MIKEYDDFTIEYTADDLEYIDDLIEYFINKLQNVLDFFGIKKLDKKVNIKFWNDIEEYRKVRNEMLKPYNKTVQDWECGFSRNDATESIISMLSYKERLKAKGHAKDKIGKMKLLIVHEFAHTCYNQFINYLFVGHTTWFKEGLATILAEQYINYNLDCSREEFLMGKAAYIHYFTIVKYALNKYGRDYVLRLAKDSKLQEQESYRLFEEVKTYLSSIHEKEDTSVLQ